MIWIKDSQTIQNSKERCPNPSDFFETFFRPLVNFWIFDRRCRDDTEILD